MNDVKSSGMHHVGFVVSNLESTLQYMESQLGQLECLRYDFKPMKAFCSGKEIHDYALKIAMITLGDGKTNIEVIEPVSDGYHKDFTQKTNGGGINHICFAVDHYDEIKRIFEQANAKFVFESETEDEIIGYRRCFYAEDPAGNVVEIKENPYFRNKSL